MSALFEIITVKSGSGSLSATLVFVTSFHLVK